MDVGATLIKIDVKEITDDVKESVSKLTPEQCECYRIALRLANRVYKLTSDFPSTLVKSGIVDACKEGKDPVYSALRGLLRKEFIVKSLAALFVGYTAEEFRKLFASDVVSLVGKAHKAWGPELEKIFPYPKPSTTLNRIKNFLGLTRREYHRRIARELLKELYK